MENREVVDSALTAFGEAESRFRVFFALLMTHPYPSQEGSWMTKGDTSILHTYQLAIHIIVRDLEPGGTLAVGPGGEATPTDHGRVKLALLEEEAFGFGIQERMDEILGVFNSDV